MAYNPDIHHRRSIRLCDYDYGTAGFYFVTICVHERRALFGTITDGIMHLNDAGRMVEDEYHRLSDHYPHIKCHEYVIMPNHFHAIIQITDDVAVGAGSACPEMGIQPVCKQGGQIGQADPAPTRHALGQIIGYFKYQATKRVNLSTRLWQRNYYEHIIRNQRSHDEIAAYILENPLRWSNDTLYVP